jgi:hypothetical protein
MEAPEGKEQEECHKYASGGWRLRQLKRGKQDFFFFFFGK